MANLIDLVGYRYGRLIVIERASDKKHGVTKWICKCECGRMTTVRSQHLRSGATRSCGCLKSECDKARALPEGEAAMRALYRQYKRNAKQRNRAWELTEEQFRELTSSCCHYCGREPQQITRWSHYNGDYAYNGIDRKDNEQGYIFDNVVPSCSECNFLKVRRDYSRFLEQVERIANHRLGMNR